MSQLDQAPLEGNFNIPTEPYQYTALNNQNVEFRLLHLLPADSPTEPLACRLEIASARTRPRFETLSYTWGGEAPCEPLIVDDKYLLNITPNLAAFLRQRRDPVTEIALWVDAVCINQDDVTEKSLQVSVMNVLYMGCRNLTIWLGTAADKSNAAMDELARLSRSTVYGRMPAISPETPVAIGKLLSRPWWTRVWIIQEVCWGALADKMMTATVCCGDRSIQWEDLVVACARIKVHETSVRQTILGVGSVLGLESVRWSGEWRYMKGYTTGFDENDFLQLAIQYRHFDATDPRDKVYSLLGMLMNKPGVESKQLPVDYDLSVEVLYLRFAIIMSVRVPGLVLLKHCIGPSNSRLVDSPSWVPDWSCKRRETPLPSRGPETGEAVPWWAVPQHNDQTIGYPTSHQAAREMACTALEDDSGVAFGETQTELLSALPPDVREKVQDLVDRGELVLTSLPSLGGSDDNPDNNPSMNEMIQRAMKSNEKITQRSFLRDWFDDQEEKRPVYSAGLKEDADHGLNFTPDLKTMLLNGIVWDTIESTNEPFPEDLDSDWEASTHFMVAVAESKRMAMVQHHDLNPYGDEDAKDWALWDAIFAGQIPDLETKPKDWLPRLPTTWSKAEPPLTSTKPGQVELTEISRISKDGEEKDGGTAGDDGNWKTIEFDDAFDPLNWTVEERLSKTERFRELANLWDSQPYDLYHRPFKLPAVVPDPYWKCRLRDDKKARNVSAASRCRKWINGMIGRDQETTEQRRAQAFKVFAQTPSMIPQGTVDFPIEKYARGRRFFITRRGYLGIGPADAQAGDDVVILLGAQVPFVLREFERMKNTFRVVGETYVSGIMKGEAMYQLDEGNRESRPIKLV